MTTKHVFNALKSATKLTCQLARVSVRTYFAPPLPFKAMWMLRAPTASELETAARRQQKNVPLYSMAQNLLSVINNTLLASGKEELPESLCQDLLHEVARATDFHSNVFLETAARIRDNNVSGLVDTYLTLITVAQEQTQSALLH